MIKRWMILLAAVAAVCSAGCNTVHGIGMDIEKAGSAIEKQSGK